MSNGRHHGDERGFTLLEVLVALVILGLSLGSLLASISLGLERAQDGRNRSVAGEIAQSVLAEVGVTIPLQPGELTDTLPNGYTWRLSMLPYGTPAERDAWPVAALHVAVFVEWQDGDASDSLHLATMRLGPAAGQP